MDDTEIERQRAIEIDTCRSQVCISQGMEILTGEKPSLHVLNEGMSIF